MAAFEMKDVRVLIVDDDPTALKLMANFIGRIGCQADFAKNGREAVEKVRATGFDICFMDILMPEMNGVEATQIIREELSRQMPIIAITSSMMKTTRETCFDVGMNDFVVKPVSLETISAMVNQYVLKQAA
ncbi:MAG: response regulator [Candidatus Omnitrophica bacterium]|nr:response regulator [Candidatus Omnitrophota bacterium]